MTTYSQVRIRSLVLGAVTALAGCKPPPLTPPAAPPGPPSAFTTMSSVPGAEPVGVPSAGLDTVAARAAGFRSVGEARIPARKRRVGTNLGGVAYWSDSFPFVDAFKAGDPWFSGHGETWNDGAALALDENGWVKSLKPGQIARTYLLADGSHHGGGPFVVLYEGKGTIEYRGSVNVSSRASGRDVVDVQPGGGFWLELHRTEPSDPIRNIRVIFPGGSCSQDALRACAAEFDCQIAPNAGSCVPFEQSYKQRIFQPTFLAEVAPFSVLRFMDWQETNAERDQVKPTQHGLAALPKRESAFWHPVPVDVMVELANTLDADPWFCMPTQADDDLVREFGQRVGATLHKDAHVYVEYTNEYWNDIFGQHQWINAQGCKRYAKRAASECTTEGAKLCTYTSWDDKQERCATYGKRFFAERSVEVGALFRKGFGAGAERVERVMAAQIGGHDWWIPSLLEVDVKGAPAYTQVDVLAVAPYFGGDVESPAEVFAQRSAPPERKVRGMVDRVLFGAEGKQSDDVYAWISGDLKALNERIPAGNRPRYVAYEGGQHLFSHDGATMDGFLNMNRDPRMEQLYTRYLGVWNELTNDALFVHFTSPGHFSKHGGWGVKEYQGQPEADAPKYRAIKRYIAGQ